MSSAEDRFVHLFETNLAEAMQPILDRFAGHIATPPTLESIRNATRQWLVRYYQAMTVEIGPNGDLDVEVNNDPKLIEQGYIDVLIRARTPLGERELRELKEILG